MQREKDLEDMTVEELENYPLNGQGQEILNRKLGLIDVTITLSSDMWDEIVNLLHVGASMLELISASMPELKDGQTGEATWRIGLYRDLADEITNELNN